MKINLITDKQNLVTEVSMFNEMNKEEEEVYGEFMNECMMDDAKYVNTAGMNKSDTSYACNSYYRKNKASLTTKKK